MTRIPSHPARCCLLQLFLGTFKNPGMNRYCFLTLLLLGLASVTAEARVGETLKQCEERYGPVVERLPAKLADSDADACVFSKGGITVLIEFRNGLAWYVMFRMLDLLPTDTEALLKANLPPGGWSSAIKVNGEEYRLSGDRRWVARYFYGKKGGIGSLLIASRDFATAQHAAYVQKISEAVNQKQGSMAPKALDGF